MRSTPSTRPRYTTYIYALEDSFSLHNLVFQSEQDLYYLNTMRWLGASSMNCLIITQVKHLQGDRQDFDGLKEKLKGTNFNIVYDINGNVSMFPCFCISK